MVAVVPSSLRTNVLTLYDPASDGVHEPPIEVCPLPERVPVWNCRDIVWPVESLTSMMATKDLASASLFLMVVDSSTCDPAATSVSGFPLMSFNDGAVGVVLLVLPPVTAAPPIF